MPFKTLYILFICFFFSACSEKKPSKSVDKTEPTIKETLKKADLLAGVPFKKLPLSDSTSFDDFDEKNPLSKELVEKLHLKDIEPDYEKFYSRYRIVLSEGIDGVVITMMIEHEMKTFLVSYRTEDYAFIDKLMIAYDEIAESAFFSHGRLTKQEITVTNYNYMDNDPVIEVKKYRVEPSGKFRELK